MKQISLVLLLIVLVKGPACGQVDSSWHFNVSPNLYVPTFGGSIFFTVFDQDQELEMEVNPGDYLEKLSFALMISAEARKGKWMAAYDLFAFDILADASFVESITVDIDNPIPGRPPIGVGVGLDAGTDFAFKGRQNTLAAGYVISTGKWHADAIAGVRWISLTSQLDWRFAVEINGPDGLVLSADGTENSQTTLSNFVLGLKGGYYLTPSKRWKAVYYLDSGFGDTRFTWQGVGGIALDTRWLDYKIVYRHISYLMKEDRVFDNLYFSGLSVGLTLKL